MKTKSGKLCPCTSPVNIVSFLLCHLQKIKNGETLEIRSFFVISVKLQVFYLEVYRSWKKAEMEEHKIFTAPKTRNNCLNKSNNTAKHLSLKIKFSLNTHPDKIQLTILLALSLPSSASSTSFSFRSLFISSSVT